MLLIPSIKPRRIAGLRFSWPNRTFICIPDVVPEERLFVSTLRSLLDLAASSYWAVVERLVLRFEVIELGVMAARVLRGRIG